VPGPWLSALHPVTRSKRYPARHRRSLQWRRHPAGPYARQPPPGSLGSLCWPVLHVGQMDELIVHYLRAADASAQHPASSTAQNDGGLGRSKMRCLSIRARTSCPTLSWSSSVRRALNNARAYSGVWSRPDPATVAQPKHPLYALTTSELSGHRRLETAIASCDGIDPVPQARGTCRPGSMT
jgi:hypothetical protein